ncbi:uncharacterized protein SCHCODRAFT_02467099, partial [Schizophyllum commune H4-8]|uniref:uncharacterized protein n=1 Tax=Schizophyllum commune (strain H4-8 / FGSC 9210) TaxID=578458 RepID=UPI00215E4F80
RRKATASEILRFLMLGDLEGGASPSRSGALLLPGRPHAIAKGERADKFRNASTRAAGRPSDSLTTARSIAPPRLAG